MIINRVAAGALALVVLLSAAAAGDEHKKPEPYALLYGTIYTPDNHLLYGAHIRIRRSDQKKPKWETCSDREGEFAQRVPPGKADYIVSADGRDCNGHKYEGKNFKPAETTVHVENDERVDFSLHLTE